MFILCVHRVHAPISRHTQNRCLGSQFETHKYSARYNSKPRRIIKKKKTKKNIMRPSRTVANTSSLRRFFSSASPIRDNQSRNNKKKLSRNKKRSSVADAEVVRWNKAITSHMRSGRCGAAELLFRRMPRRSVVSYNAMLSGYVSNGLLPLALRLFRAMPRRDATSWNTILHGHVLHRDLAAARRVFDEMPQRDPVSWNIMISACANNGLVELARDFFERAPAKNAVSWNGVLAAYARNGRLEAARELFDSNPSWEIVSWNAMIAGYAQRKRMADARELFDRMPERDAVSWNTVISGYAQCGDMVEAKRLFDTSPHRDVFTWTAMVSGYAQNGMLDNARKVFDVMPERNQVSWNAMIAAYIQHKMMDKAKDLFDQMPCRNVSSWNTMITGYAQVGNIEEARSLFDTMAERDSVSWAAMIAGYSQSGFGEEALKLFIEMGRSGERMNRSAFTCALSTCADIAVLECGMQVHGRLMKAGYGMGCFVGNALIAMYFKCGSIKEALEAFEVMEERDVVSWNTMIMGYARHGLGKESLGVFDTMMRTTNTKPDDITMVGVLSACSHAGLVEKGISYFYSMHRDFGVTAKPEHYTCMIDLLGRAGRLEEALDLMAKMPSEPDSTMWGALLGASRIHRNTELGEKAAKMIFEMEPDNAGMYVLLSNIYAASGKWNYVDKMRVLMHERGVRKVPGFSWIEVKNKVHTFSVGDSIHPEKEKIYEFLEELDKKMKKAGYVSATEIILHDVEEEEKEHMLKYHSEKLAVAFGILNVPIGRPIRVIKNLRVCKDCHNAIKYVSAIENRLIILRDSNRFHHFSGGSCSCGDYW
ncbi:pentatricopeptide repeat-containing protein At4g02750 [Ananas comosus]|uniref:Pentatricopeptide repeat-containing protein At4g02750 n=2 Tax=Ananas comosus TaxID=4615 RepID=A0A6P5G610_ANACO|nr:pentatricopeptide repeat-containing protein At4g02750 [Ananas comosus]